MPAVFDCHDCGDRVYAAGIDTPPSPPRCGICDWINGIAPAAGREETRRSLYNPRQLLHWETIAAVIADTC